MEKITRANCEKFNIFEHVTLKNADGSRLRSRRNGKTKLWKTRPDDFSIPCKYGMYYYFNITHYNGKDWEGVE
jgi:hypothetical protein